MIDEPGKGRHWVRQGGSVGHVIIDQIKDGVVVLKGTKGTFEKGVGARPVQRSLLAGSSGVSLGTSGQSGSGPGPALVSSGPESVGATDTGTPSIGPTPEDIKEEMANAAKIFREMAAMAAQGQDESSKTEKKYFPDSEALRITGKEAKKLGDLGQELEGVRRDPNRPKSRKVDKSPKKTYKPRKSSKSKSTSQPTSKKRTKPKRRSGKRQ